MRRFRKFFRRLRMYTASRSILIKHFFRSASLPPAFRMVACLTDLTSYARRSERHIRLRKRTLLYEEPDADGEPIAVRLPSALLHSRDEIPFSDLSTVDQAPKSVWDRTFKRGVCALSGAATVSAPGMPLIVIESYVIQLPSFFIKPCAARPAGIFFTICCVVIACYHLRCAARYVRPLVNPQRRQYCLAH